MRILFSIVYAKKLKIVYFLHSFYMKRQCKTTKWDFHAAVMLKIRVWRHLCQVLMLTFFSLFDTISSSFRLANYSFTMDCDWILGMCMCTWDAERTSIVSTLSFLRQKKFNYNFHAVEKSMLLYHSDMTRFQMKYSKKAKQLVGKLKLAQIIPKDF